MNARIALVLLVSALVAGCTREAIYPIAKAFCVAGVEAAGGTEADAARDCKIEDVLAHELFGKAKAERTAATARMVARAAAPCTSASGR